MTIRTATTVALAVALLGASLPAIDEARVQHADSRVAAELGRVERAAETLAAENAVVDEQPASARLTLHLPERSLGSRGLARLTFAPTTDRVDVRWSIVGGSNRSMRFDVPVAGADEGLTIERGGRFRLVLELHRRAGQRVVLVRRPQAVG